MLVRFLQNLGTDDASAVSKAFTCTIDAKKCVVGAVVDLPEDAAGYLAGKYKALLETVDVKGVAKDAKIKGTSSASEG